MQASSSRSALSVLSSAHPPGQPSCAGSCPRCPPWWAPSAPTRSCQGSSSEQQTPSPRSRSDWNGRDMYSVVVDALVLLWGYLYWHLENVRTQTKRSTISSPSSLLAWARVDSRDCSPWKWRTSCSILVSSTLRCSQMSNMRILPKKNRQVSQD